MIISERRIWTIDESAPPQIVHREVAQSKWWYSYEHSLLFVALCWRQPDYWFV